MAAKTDIAGRRKKTKGEPEYARYLDKDITERTERFSEYLSEQTGYEDIDERSVQLAIDLNSAFQKSPENQARKAARAEEIEAEREEREARKAARAEAKTAPKEPKAKKASEEPAPAKKAAKKTAAKKAAAPAEEAGPAKTAKTRIRKSPSKEVASSVAEDF